MNKKTFIIIGVFICLLFAIPMASATDVDVHNGLAIESAAADFSMDAVNNASVEDSNSIVSNVADSSDSNIIPDNNNLSGIQYDSADVKNSKTLAASNDNVLGADGTGNTFADLQYLIDHASGTLTLDRDFNFVSGSDDDHANGIIINNTLTINGGGHTIDAKNLARIFNISASNVQLNNLILINGKSAENGGAIYIQTQGGKTNLENITLKFCEAENGGGIYTVTPTAMKNITAINCTATGNGGAIFAAADGTDVALDIFNLYNNTALNGGAFYTHGDNIKITNVDAQNNTASGQGGAVYAYGHHLTLDGIKFIKNHAGINPTDNSSGGAIYFDTSSDSIVNNVLFDNNYATKNGGAIAWARGSYFGELYNSNFTNNSAGRSGGAVRWVGDNGTVENCTFTDNRANGTNRDPDDYYEDGLVKLGGNGGAVIWLGSIGYIKNSNFTDNYAALNGGAAFFRAESDTDPCNDTHIIGCNFINNNAERNGGAIGWNDRASHGSLQDSVFINNTAGRSGGAVFWKGSNGTITNSNFTSNHANGTNLVQPPGFLTEGGNGGAIIITGSDVNITYSKFVNNTARARGGAVYLQNNSNTLILNSTFEENFAGTNGGALDFYQGAANGRVINSTFLHNMANKTGGSIYWNGHNGVINGSLFRDNIALNQGTELNGTPITDAGDGGAVIWTGSYGVIENTTFINNTANRRGGAIYLLGESNTDGTLNYCENVTVKNCTFDSNIARTNGGAIDWFKGARYGTVEDSVFINNIANRTGGAIFWNGINGTVRKSNFTNNTAKGQEYGITPYGENTTGGDGGAIMWSGSNGLIDECNFDNNSAKWRGGAMFLQRYDDNILCENTTVSNSNFTFNHAGSNGGAIEWTLGARYGDLVNSTFINNTADRSGGAVFWYGMYGDINGSTFINNSAIGNYTPGSDNRPDVSYLEDGQYSGGAVYVRGDHTVIYNDTFLSNSVPRQGGAIFIKGENATIDKCNFTNHTSQLDGGAIYVDGNITHISNSSFVNNTAETGHGGAIYWEGFNGTVESSNFTHNNNQKGGAIYIDGNLTKINDCNFTNNTATQGGAILVQGNNATINLSNFIGHHTDEEGGAIYVNGTSTCIDNSTFTNNTSHDDGGAIAWWGDNGTVFNVTCLNNSGTSEGHTSSGGTISIYGSNIVMDRLNVTEGYVITRQDGGRERIARGGAIFLTGNNVTISNSTFTNCSVNSTWESGLNNNESDGGAMYIIGNETKLINVTLEDCLAHDGGAIYWMGNDGYADKLNASGCNATDAGGVMYISGNNVTVSNSTFNNNTAWDDGAAIDWIGNEGKMFNVTASDNKGISKGHTSKGGTFSIEGNDTDIDTVNVSNSYITGSGDKPPQGGGMFVSGNNANITNVVFTNCSVNFTGNLAGKEEASGGAIYIVGNNTNIVDGSFSQNSAYADGGAIFVAGENCTMNNTNFTDNVAHNDGGAIQIEGNNAKIYNLTADSNYADSRSGSSQGGTLIITGNRTSMELINISNSYVDGISGRNSIRGGAIFLTGNDCNISNASFTNCSVKWDATNCSGGAIYIIGNNTNITNVNFTNNTSPQDGGAIYVTGTNFILDGGNFTNNTAKLRGGAIFLTDNKESKILNSYFESNYAGRNGGAIDFYAGAEDGLVSNCGFVNNTAGASGGSIFWEGTRGIVEYSNFTGSRAWGNNTESSGVAPNKGRGGSIIWLGDRGEIRECVFDDSESLKEGSALYIIGNDFAAYNSNVTNSVSNQSSGTIYIQGTYAKIGDCYMDNNTVKDKGAGIYVKGNFVSISGTTIKYSTSGDVASAVYVEGNRTEIKDSLISNNVANKSGAVYIAGSRSTVTNVNFENNTAKTSAGAIYISGDDTIVTKSNFTNNTAFKGGAILYEGQRITISYSNFDKNRANGTSEAKGGSISIKGKSGDSIIGCNFTDSSSGSSGGSIHWLAGGEGGLIQNCTFINSSTDGIKVNGQGHGGAIIWEANTNGVVDNCTFINCEAKGTKNGGAIYMGTASSSATNPVISNCTIINCSNGERGVINIYGINATLYNITFVNMSKVATSDKGFHAIEFEKLTTGRVVNCTFENIGGDYDGGAIKVDSGSDIVIANNTFINVSTKRNGGAFYSVSVSGQQVFENNTFINCSSNSNGGAAYFNNNVTSFKNNTFINNSLSTTNGRGGAVYLLAEGSVIENSTFINNSGAVQGGAVFSSKAITINSSYFESNLANEGTSNVQGGAVFTDGGNIIVNNSTFIANSALHSGGALYAKNNKDIIVSNSTFLHNTAPEYDGGAIYTGGNVYINESSTLMYNNASSASAIKAKSVYINDTVLLENQAHFRQWADQRYNLKNDHVSINGTLRGNDLLLNAIVADNYGFKNVTYCGENGEETNTDDVTSALSYNEVHILVLLEVYNAQNELIDTVEQYTDANGHYTFDFDLVDASNHSFKVIHPEDNYYTGAEYTIGKALSNLTITSQNITHPEDENISFQVTGGLSDIPSGNITVIINDTNGNIIYNNTIPLNASGEAAISLPRLNATEYYIYAKYNGDDNYLPDNETDVFHVSMGESFINIGIENYTYNETRNITITIPYIEDGKVTVIVSNENYTQLNTVYITEGTEEFEIALPILDAGEYTIQAVFHGNNNYFPSENTTNFTVYKAASIINVSADNVTGGEHAVADIHIDPEVATQTVDVVVRNEAGNIVAEFEGLGLLDSATSITLPVLPKGKYNITVTYGGDKNHNESVNSTIFYVTKDLFPIEINASNMTYGEDEIINITVPANADSDKLYIKLNWTENKTVSELGLTIDENGVIRIDTSLLPNRLDAGNYTIDVYYEGDDDYLSNSSSLVFEVVPANVTMTVTPQNITYGAIENITIEVPELNGICQNGALTIYVNSTSNESIRYVIDNYDIGTDGKAIWNVLENILPAGDYIVDAVYAGNNNYNPANRTERFTVSKAAVWIEIDVNNIFVDDTEVINVTVHGIDGGTVPSGEIKIIVRTVNDRYELNGTGQYSISLPNEVEGTAVSVSVIYYGDDNYNGTDNTTDYNVTRKNTTTTVDALTPIKYGTIEDLNMTVNYTDATGTITLYINSTVEGFANITKVFTLDGATGKANWDIDELVLPVGTYDATAVYSGDRKYFNSTSQIKLIVVEQNDNYEITVEANNTVYREDQVIIVTVPEDANGTVTIVIVGTEISLTEQVVDGKAVFTIPTGLIDYLEVHDNYNVTATYNGDDNYAAGKTADDLFNVTKADSHIDVTAQDINYTQIENITVILPDINASGRLLITVNNSSGIVRTHTVDVFATTDGVIYPFADLPAGNYTVKVAYSDDHNYKDSEASYDFEVAKVDPVLTENSPDIVYGNNENITVIITGVTGGADPTGTIEVKVDGVTVDTITIGEGELEYIVIKPGVDPRHNITVIYSGDDNYNAVTITGEFEVSQNTTQMEEDSPDIVYGNNETITITLPNDATGTVYLVVNGSYYTPISIDENHQAVFNIIAPEVGNYNFTAYYSGDGNYTANNISGAFNVTKANVTLAETHAASITYGANNTITVTITGVEGPEGILAPTGTIKVLVDGVEIGNVTIGESLVFTSIKPFADPQHNITIIYSGDKNYNDKSINDGTFEVTQNNTVEISEDSPNITYGENETITVTIAGDATGTITVTVGGEQVGETVTITEITEEDKIFTFNITKPDGGVYDDLSVVYSGDSNYAARTLEGEFTVSPINPNITEESPDIVYTNNETIAITVPEGATGTLTVTVKNSKDETIVDGQVLTIGVDDLEISIEKPDVENYTIKIEYSGCANYTAKNITGEFKVTKASNEITVVPTNITYGQTETITVTVPEGATGNVTITIGSYTDELEIASGSTEVVFTIPKTTADALLKVNENYVVFANYSGDENFESAVANAPFHVDPANTTTTIQVANITYGDDEIINITVTGVAGGDVPAGFVTITINGTDISLTKRVDGEGKAQFNVTSLVAGEYVVNATFESSSINYNDCNNTAGFNVTKADVKETNRNITAVNITYGDDETITVVLNETNITGNITITINGTQIETKELSEGKAVFIIPSAFADFLEANEYNVIANYSGDANYNGFAIEDNLNADFKVDKANVTVEVAPIDIIFKETEEINVTVTGVVIDGDASDVVTRYNLTGKVTIYIDGVENQTKDISAVDADGILHFTVEGLAVGMHNVTAVYHDDRNYNDKNVTKDFEVINALPENMQVIPQNITYHVQNETITVDLGEVLNGTIVLYINETLVATIDVVDQSSISYTNATLSVGNYTAKAVFTANGDSVEASANFTVSKAPTTVTVNAENSTYGDTQVINVTVDNTVGDKFNLTGNVSITINGVDYGNKTVIDGKAVFEIDGLEARENYVVIATYYGDVNYEDNTGQDTFKVSKADVKDANKNITAINITYGEDETITVTLNENNITGKVTITINGSEIDTKELEDGKVIFTVKDLEANGYNVVANYSGDTNYNPFTIEDNLNADFTVAKANSTVEVEAIPSIVYGNNETITVTVPIRNHTGTVTLTINGTDYEFIKHLTAEDGDTIVLTNVSGLAVGIYNVTVKYEDDRNYNNSEDSVLFEVTRAEPVSIVVDPQNITYGQIENITVTVNPIEGYATPSGNVTIRIVGTDIEMTLNLTDGSVTFNIPDLAVGTYTVEAVYSGDANYSSINGMNVFEVSPAVSNVTIQVANITYGDTEYANITIPNNNASGKVIIRVDGQLYQTGTLTNDTPINLALGNLSAGDHTIDVEYYGDHNYNDSLAHAEFTVSPANSSVIVVTQNITYQEIENITVTVPVANATGTLVVKINGSEINRTKFNGEDSPEIVINVPDLAVGEYNVTVEYIDDVNYNRSTNSSIFHVDKANITDIPGTEGMTVAPVNITYLDPENIVVTVDVPNATGLVTITINGTDVDLTKNITENDNGSVTFTVPGLVVGEYNVTAVYHDDVNYNDEDGSALFHVSPANSTVNVVPTNITYLDDETITVTVPITNATGLVTITINGTDVNITQPVSEGVATFTVPGLAAGEYNVTAVYHDDVNYNNSTNSALFHVDKANITDVPGKEGMTVAPVNITYLDSENIVVTVDVPNATGLVTITINGTDVELTKNITENDNGSVTFTVPGLVVGEYNVSVSYHDDVNYNDADGSALFHVSPANSTIEVVPTNITYLDDETITVTVPITNVTGKVTITINGTNVNMTQPVNNGEAVFTVPDLPAGEYNVTAVYHDDVNYNNSTNSSLFHVSKAKITDLNLTALNITYGDNGTITVTIADKNASGNITINVNGTEYGPEELVDGTISFNVPDLVAGDYEVVAHYSGDDNYNATDAETTFNVDKATPTVYAVGTNITYGSDDQITVIVDGKNITGNVTIFIDGDEIDTKDLTQISTGGRVFFNVPGLTGGNHTVVAVYNGDDNHYSSSGEDNFTVSKATPSMDVNTTNIDYGEVENITITVNPVEGGETPTGNVTVTVTNQDGRNWTFTEVPIEDGKVTIPVENLPAGNYTVNATYNGDDNYDAGSGSGSFSVGRIAPTVDVSCVNITYGDNETITVTVTGADGKAVPTGKVNITVNGDTYEDQDLTDGSVTIKVPGLAPDTYPVTVSYSGDENYTAQTGSGEFVVSKANATMDVNTTNIDYGENETITVNITGSGDGVLPTGKVNITVTDKDGINRTFTDVPIVDGVAQVNATDLPAGDYDVTVTYPGDDNYNAGSGSGSFSVGRIAPTVDVSCVNITYGDNETITVTVTGADGKAVPTGKVNITVNGDTYEDQDLTDGSVTIKVPGLAPDTYPVTVSYSGDENYTAQTGSGEFVVSKANATMDVNTTNIDYGENETITVNITGSGDGVLPTGKVNITVTDKDGINRTFTDVPIVDGIAQINATDLPAGDYDVTVTYPGDDNYNSSSATGKFSIGKVDPTIKLETENITYGDEETIKVKLDAVDGGAVPTGTVNITVTDKDGNERIFTDVPVENGVAEININDLAAGNYTVDAKYSGDNNYNGDSVSGKFEVKKAVPHINIHVYDIIYGDVEEITVTCDAPGTVDVIVNGVIITVSLEDGYDSRLFASALGAYSGKARVDLFNLAVGTYPAKAVYNGNENYTSASDEDVFHVIKANTTTKISVDDIKVGEDAVINVEVGHDRGTEVINANITVTVDGTEYTVEIKDGKGSLTVSGLSAGTHTVKAEYPGSHNYTNSSNSTSFKVSKHDSSIKIKSDDIKVGDDETITVTVPDDATGNVTITVNGKDYTAPVKNGKATFEIPGLKAGKYEVNVSYSGDDKYKPAKGKDTFKVSKVKPDIDVDAPDIHVGEDGTITVTVPDDATGTITIEVDGRNYTASIKNGKAVFHISGLSPGSHGIKVFYSGDEKYLSRTCDGGSIKVIADDNGGSPSKGHGGIDMADKKTGNPLVMMVLVLFALVLVPFKRSKKGDDEEEN